MENLSGGSLNELPVFLNSDQEAMASGGSCIS